MEGIKSCFHSFSCKCWTCRAGTLQASIGADVNRIIKHQLLLQGSVSGGVGCSWCLQWFSAPTFFSAMWLYVCLLNFQLIKAESSWFCLSWRWSGCWARDKTNTSRGTVRRAASGWAGTAPARAPAACSILCWALRSVSAPGHSNSPFSLFVWLSSTFCALYGLSALWQKLLFKSNLKNCQFSLLCLLNALWHI